MSKFASILLLITFYLVSGNQYPALAIDAIQKGVEKPVYKSCSEELKTYCKHIEPGDGRVATCLGAYRHKLSDTCKGILKKAGDHIQKALLSLSHALVDCRAHVPKYCPDLQPGRANVLDCIDKLKLPLSNICNTALKKYREALKFKN